MNTSAPSGSASSRPVVSGKFFHVDGRKFFAKGVTYGPFAPNAAGEPFCEREQTGRDFDLIARLRANLLRVYYAPPRWLLDLAQERGLKVLIDVPWGKHLCFLDSARSQREAREAVRTAVKGCARHPAVFAYSVVNEISPDISRWSGARRVADFIDTLVEVAKDVDPECLCTFGNYPPTEFLRPENIDFVCFNVYLHQQRAFENYLARLQMIADDEPLLLGEMGIDSLGEGEGPKSEMLEWQIESAFRGGVAGAIVYSFTDEWHKNGREVMEWQFGLTTRGREPKQSFAAVERKFGEAPYFGLARWPKVSVVVACYNGGRTLQPCLESLRRLNYPDYEVIIVDDGSTDITPQVASLFKEFHYVRQAHQGLSVARNTGIKAAQGEIVAFTDADCRPDEDWLRYALGDLLRGAYAGMGGHNFLPPEDSPVAAAVMVSPGGPAHVMLTDRQAEHIPGCNMIFYKWALEEIGCFDPIYHQAGDDVDICWRLQQRGYRIGFSPAAFVWHYRRSNVAAYLAQQRGYGEAEALLVRRHPEYFNMLGGSMWHGRIYTASKFGLTVRKPIIYHGVFATGFFQSVYRAEPAAALMFFTSLEYHVIVNIPLLALSVAYDWLAPAAAASVLLSFGVCVAAAAQADLPRSRKRWWSRAMVAILFFLQPIVRGWARYRGRMTFGPAPKTASETLESVALEESEDLDSVEYWGDQSVDRVAFVRRIIGRLAKQGWELKVDEGWSEFDVEVSGSRWAFLRLATVSEPHQENKQTLRCRLQTGWSLPAKVAVFALVCFDLIVIGFVWRKFLWIWLLLGTVPALAWHVRRHERDLQRLIRVLLDDVAAKAGLKKLAKERA